MKHITCKQMGGPCDTVFEGESSGDIAKAAEAHIVDKMRTDPRHKETYDMMAEAASTPESHAKWEEGFQKMFNEAPSA
jgi:hypothetical protein